MWSYLRRPFSGRQASLAAVVGVIILLVLLPIHRRVRADAVANDRAPSWTFDVLDILMWLLTACVILLVLCALILLVGEALLQMVPRGRIARRSYAALTDTQRAAAAGVPWPRPGEALTTALLRVESVGPQNAPAFLDLHGGDFGEVHGWPPDRFDEMATAVRQYVELGICLPGSWLLRLRTDRGEVEAGTAVGWITVTRVDAETPASVGLQLAADHRGFGYATEALQVVLTRADRDDCTPVTMATAIDNVAMRRVAEKVRFAETGRGPHTLPDGTGVDAVFYEWPAA